MGYSGGENILEAMVKVLKKLNLTDDQRYEILKTLTTALGEADWDTWYMSEKEGQRDLVLWKVYCEFYNLDEHGEEKE